MAKVTVSLGTTINTGNFESFRIDLGAEDDKRLDETMGEAHERVFNFVLGRLKKKVAQVNKELAEENTAGGY